MLRPHLACFTASLLLSMAACSRGDASEETVPEEVPPTTEAEQKTEKKTKGSSSSSGGGEGEEVPIDPGTIDPGGETSGGETGPDEVNGISTKVDLSEVKITVQGQARHYVLAVPKNYDANKAYPLVIALHGDGGNAKSFLKESRLTVVAGDQAIIAFPDQVLDLFTSYYDNNDQRLVAATIIQVKKNRNIDAGKIWGFGHSKGAFMLNELGCRKPGLFTAIASHAGGAPQSRDGEGNVYCPDAIPLNSFITMGTNDDIGGGQFQADYWAGKASCDGTTHQTDIQDCRAYNNCSNWVVFCKLQGQGHALYANAAADSWKWWTSL